MRHVNGNRLYGLIIVITILVIGLTTMFNTKRIGGVEYKQQEESPYYQPVKAFGVLCDSAVSFGGRIPYEIWISHPPGRREDIDEAVRQLVRTGANREAWTEAVIATYRIGETRCYHTWEERYSALKTVVQTRVDELLEQPGKRTEADLRQAILRAQFERVGTEEAALKLFPLTEEKRP